MNPTREKKKSDSNRAWEVGGFLGRWKYRLELAHAEEQVW